MKCFGGGYGLSAPDMPSRFYWLIDHLTGTGDFYVTSGWLGCQLASFRWRAPLPQERIILHGATFRVFNARRRWGLYMVSWHMEALDPLTIDEKNKRIRALYNVIGTTDQVPWTRPGYWEEG